LNFNLNFKRGCQMNLAKKCTANLKNGPPARQT
jgi:hypothetical protein